MTSTGSIEVRLRRLDPGPSGEAELQRLVEAASDYKARVRGSIPSPGTARTIMASGPDGLAPGDRYFLALDVGGEAIGWADLLRRFPSPDTAVIVDLVLVPPHRGHGLGRRCYLAVERLILGWEECSLIRLGVLGVNSSATGFWCKMGFLPTGERFPQTIGRIGTDVTVFAKPIRPAIPGLSRPTTG